MNSYVSFPHPSGEVNTKQHQFDDTKPHESPSSKHQKQSADMENTEHEIRLLKKRLRELQSSIHRHRRKENELQKLLSMQQYDFYCFKQSFTDLQKENLALVTKCDRYRSERDKARYPTLFADCGAA
ncbi:uncharacterized protein N7484_007032 [Penicillium longicatenatum]|uniref:uncharacterized protein n=1 Tax=Penicillium longicatenatum TaxID=1561947 RepID=UPI0025488BB6|nr:uncharacterized protein N7484_007032 [Penicillium longicatenatum]KAJ5639170.1 hypothetical protein N7484_007032 [Penicillium longicatenatum]